MRSSAAVIFRRVASKARKDPLTNENKELFLTLPGNVKDQIKSGLLQCLSTEQVSHVRNKIGDAVAEIARQCTDAGKQEKRPPCGRAHIEVNLAGEPWPELLGRLFECSQSQDSTVRECAFRIFATTPGIIERQHETVVQEVFGSAFRDSSVNVRMT